MSSSQKKLLSYDAQIILAEVYMNTGRASTFHKVLRQQIWGKVVQYIQLLLQFISEYKGKTKINICLLYTSDAADE